jgi:hypothetical protein
MLTGEKGSLRELYANEIYSASGNTDRCRSVDDSITKGALQIFETDCCPFMSGL